MFIFTCNLYKKQYIALKSENKMYNHRGILSDFSVKITAMATEKDNIGVPFNIDGQSCYFKI